MLVLTRKCGQRITIGDVVITITHTSRTAARIGIEAPDHLLISRDDVKPPSSRPVHRIRSADNSSTAEGIPFLPVLQPADPVEGK